jgi:hypothetical protein
MSPLAEYLEDTADTVPCADRFEQPLNHSLALKLDRYRVKTMQESVMQFESIVESSQVAYAIIDAIALTCIETSLAASPAAIMRLPKACVYPWDRESSKDCTKSCGVCSDRLVDGVAVTRLPCGHEYHLYCVLPWLSKNCTCPECRYELETKNPRFEVGRKQRMKKRATVTCSCKGTHSCFFPFIKKD